MFGYGTKRTSAHDCVMSANDPNQTSSTYSHLRSRGCIRRFNKLTTCDTM